MEAFSSEAFWWGLKEVVCGAAVLRIRNMIGELGSGVGINLNAVFLGNLDMQNAR